AHRIRDVDRAGAGLDGRLDASAEEIMFATRAVLWRPFDIVAELAGMADAVVDRLMYRLRFHLQLELHVQRAGGDEGVDAWTGGAVERLPGTVDVALRRAGQSGNGGVADALGHLAHRLEIAVRRDGEAGFDDVDTHLLEHRGDAQLLLEVHRGARRLLAVAQGGVEDDDAVAR